MLLIGNGRVITRDSDHPYFEKGAVVCDGETILEVGEESELKKKYADAEYVDAQGGVIKIGRAHV